MRHRAIKATIFKHANVPFCFCVPLSNSMPEGEVHRITSSSVTHNLLESKCTSVIYNNILWTGCICYHLVVVRSLWYHLHKKCSVCISLINCMLAARSPPISTCLNKHRQFLCLLRTHHGVASFHLLFVHETTCFKLLLLFS